MRWNIITTHLFLSCSSCQKDLARFESKMSFSGASEAPVVAMYTCKLSWKLDAWYWAYLAMVVWDLLLSQGHVWEDPVRFQFSSAGCCTWVLTSTVCSALASTRDLVENSPRSDQKEREKRRCRYGIDQWFSTGGPRWLPRGASRYEKYEHWCTFQNLKPFSYYLPIYIVNKNVPVNVKL